MCYLDLQEVKKQMFKTSKALKKKIFRSLPEEMRDAAIRRLVRLPQTESAGCTFQLASTPEEYQQAFELLHDCYVDQKFISRHPTRMRLLPHFALPNTVTLVAIDQSGKVIGTLSIIKQGPLPLPMEKAFSLSSIKHQPGGFAEISALAVDKKYRRANGGNIYFFMLNYMYNFCVSHLGIRHLCIVIHPKDEDFYRGLLRFHRLSNQVIVDYLGAPALAMALDLEWAYQEYAKIYDSLPPEKNLLRFMTRKFGHLKYVQRPYRLKTVSTLTPEIFRKVFLEQGHFFESISFAEYKILRRALFKTDLFPFFRDDSLDRLTRRSEFRVAVEMSGKTHQLGRLISLQITNVSASGLRLRVAAEDFHLIRTNKVRVQVDLGAGLTSQLIGELLWRNFPELGFHIQKADATWRTFANYLYRGTDNYLCGSG